MIVLVSINWVKIMANIFYSPNTWSWVTPLSVNIITMCSGRRRAAIILSDVFVALFPCLYGSGAIVIRFLSFCTNQGRHHKIKSLWLKVMRLDVGEETMRLFGEDFDLDSHGLWPLMWWVFSKPCSLWSSRLSKHNAMVFSIISPLTVTLYLCV